jgi:hypothetical protein
MLSRQPYRSEVLYVQQSLPYGVPRDLCLQVPQFNNNLQKVSIIFSDK